MAVMSAVILECAGNKLLIQLNGAIVADNDRLVRDTISQLDLLAAAGSLDGGGLLLVDGRATVAMSFAIAAKIGHRFATVAVSDPKLREVGGYYAVAISHSPTYAVGDILNEDANGDVTVVAVPPIAIEGYSYYLHQDGDTLLVGFNPLVKVRNDRLLKDADVQLRALVADRSLSGGDRILVNGAISLPLAYLFSHQLSHLYRTVAVFDPKMAVPYVVTSTSDADCVVGSTLPLGTGSTFRGLRVVLCGPPNSGKSCLREGLKQAVLNLNAKIYPYVITAHPDGDGCFTFETYRFDEAYGAELKRTLKKQSSGFSPDFVTLVAGWVRNARVPLSLVDVGGKMLDDNRAIMSEATHAIVLSNSMEEIVAWREFCGSLKPKPLAVIAEVFSDAEKGSLDRLEATEPIVRGSICGIQRGQDLSERAVVVALAKKLVEMAKEV
jgi:CRISPR-associated protein Csx3